MKIVPLDEEGKYLMKLFMDMAPDCENSRVMYRVLHDKAVKSGNPKLCSPKKVTKKMKRLFLDIYKRICLKLSKKNANKIHLDSDMEDKVAIAIRHFLLLNTKDIFFRICYRYIGDKQKGKVSEGEEMQFYEQVNKKVLSDAKSNKQIVDYEDDQWQNEEGDEKRVKLFANNQFENESSSSSEEDEDDSGEKTSKKKKGKNWDKLIEKNIKKVEEQEKSKGKKEKKQKEIHTSKVQSKPKQEEIKKKVLPERAAKKAKKQIQKSPEKSQSEESQQEQNLKEQNEQSSSSGSSEGSSSSSSSSVDEGKQSAKQETSIQKTSRKEAKKQELKKSETETRKAVKVSGPKDTKPVQIKSDSQIWTESAYKTLCKEFLAQQNNLNNLAKEFSVKMHITPVISVKELADRLINIMQVAFKIFVKISTSDYRKHFQVTQISKGDPKYIEMYLRTSKAALIRRKLVRIYLKNQDPDFELRQREAQEIFLHIKEGLAKIYEKADSELCGEDELITLLETGRLEIEEEKSSEEPKPKSKRDKKASKDDDDEAPKEKRKRGAHITKDAEQLVTFKAGKTGRKLRK